jgi:gliding motility-associated protein GldM
MFDHAPIVAACAMMTSLKVDVLNGESLAAEFMSSKVNAPPFNFNKIEPLAFARTGYINAGDSLDLSVMIAAYDSTETPKIKYGINADTLPENWKEVTGKINLPGDSPGEFKVKGQIGVKGRSGLEWKNWNFRYTVGKPSGAVSLPEMNVLYRGYDNKVVGAVSGYAGYNLSMSNGSISKGSEFWIAKPSSGREATISISGVAEDGSSANVGQFKFRVQNLPAPSVYLGALEDGEEAPAGTIRAQTRLFAKYPPEIPLNATFSLVSWEVSVAGAPRPEKGTGQNLSPKALSLIKQAQRGATITFMTIVRGPDGKNRKKSAAFKVK